MAKMILQRTLQGVIKESSKTNSATAEESAASSEELSGQAKTLKQLVGRFKLKASGAERQLQKEFNSETKSVKTQSMSSLPSDLNISLTGKYGKY